MAGPGDRSSGAAVGGYVDALCGKCRDTTSHIVIAKIGGKPTRVECRTCHATHQYRAAGGSSARRSGGSTASGARKKAAAAPALNPEDVWMRAMRGAPGPAVPYAISRRFEPGQRLSHPTFGEGVVSRVASPTVCEVVFNTGTRKLLMGS